MKYTEQQLLDFDAFFGDEGELKLHTKKIVKVRKEHPCFLGMNSDLHTIKPGERAIFEKALVDGDYWGKYYMCFSCIEKELDLIYGEDE